jgi:hypothetical protein
MARAEDVTIRVRIDASEAIATLQELLAGLRALQQEMDMTLMKATAIPLAWWVGGPGGNCCAPPKGVVPEVYVCPKGHRWVYKPNPTLAEPE